MIISPNTHLSRYPKVGSIRKVTEVSERVGNPMRFPPSLTNKKIILIIS